MLRTTANLAFCLIICFKRKEENIPAPAALPSPPACADILYYPLLAPRLVIQYHNAHTPATIRQHLSDFSASPFSGRCVKGFKGENKTLHSSNGEFSLQRQTSPGSECFVQDKPKWLFTEHSIPLQNSDVAKSPKHCFGNLPLESALPSDPAKGLQPLSL